MSIYLFFFGRFLLYHGKARGENTRQDKAPAECLFVLLLADSLNDAAADSAPRPPGGLTGKIISAAVDHNGSPEHF